MSINKFSGEYGYLSNFYPHRIKYKGELYPSTEHAFQAAKTTDVLKRKPFQVKRKTITAGQAKRLGRKLKLRPDWESVKVKVMEECLRLKFSDPFLGKKLLSTGDKELIEANTWKDRIWGVYKGKGQNLLGKLLMKIRKELSA